MSVHLVAGGNVLTLDSTGRSPWMKKIMELTPVTSGAGVIDVPYLGDNSPPGTAIYVVVYRPNSTPVESLAWPDTVQ